MTGTRTCCSSACSLSYAQAKRHLLHTITAMGMWASPSRLTYAAENSHEHHQALDIHARILPQPDAQEIFFMHGLVFSDDVTFFFGQRTSVLQQFSLARFHRPFCAMNPPIANSTINILYSFLVILLFFLHKRRQRTTRPIPQD